MTDAAAPPTQMPMIERRRIEAEMIKPIYEELKAEYGVEAAQRIVERAVKKSAVAQAQAFAAQEKGGGSLESFVAIMPLWTKEDALRVRPIRQDSETFEFDVVRCRYAEMYREMGLGEIGHLLSCNRDGAFIEGYAPDVSFTRTQTLMQGASHCDFRYRASKRPT